VVLSNPPTGEHMSADLNPKWLKMTSSCSAMTAGRLNGASVTTRWHCLGLIFST
jgi:hypothetical protein